MVGFGLVAVGTAWATPPAEDTGACPQGMFAGSRPAAGDTGVPTDVAPVVLFDAPCGMGAWVGELLDTAGAPLQSFEVVPQLFTNLALARLDVGPLDPDTAYTLRLTGYDTVDVPFTTGAGPLGGDAPSAPTVALTVDDVQWAGPVLSVAGSLSVSDLPADPVVLHLQTSGNDTVFLDVVAPWQVGIQRTVQPGTDLCATVFVEDLVGRASDLARACSVVSVPERPVDTGVEDTRHGCATAGSSSAGAFAGVAAALAALARRRRRCTVGSA